MMWAGIISAIASVILASALYWHVKQHGSMELHKLVYWQDGCLWYAKCKTCGAGSSAPGGDGAQAMSEVKHQGKPLRVTSGQQVIHG